MNKPLENILLNLPESFKEFKEFVGHEELSNNHLFYFFDENRTMMENILCQCAESDLVSSAIRQMNPNVKALIVCMLLEFIRHLEMHYSEEEERANKSGISPLDSHRKKFIVSGENLIGFLSGIVDSDFEFEEKDRELLELRLGYVSNKFNSICDTVKDMVQDFEESDKKT